MNRAYAAWALADAVTLVAIGTLVAWLVAQAHALLGAHWLAVLIGVPVALLVQSLAAALIGVWLGSIETKVPSLVAGGLAAAAICLVSLVTAIDPSAAAVGGGLIGAVVFADVRRYARVCRLAVAVPRRKESA